MRERFLHLLNTELFAEQCLNGEAGASVTELARWANKGMKAPSYAGRPAAMANDVRMD